MNTASTLFDSFIGLEVKVVCAMAAPFFDDLSQKSGKQELAAILCAESRLRCSESSFKCAGRNWRMPHSIRMTCISWSR